MNLIVLILGFFVLGMINSVIGLMGVKGFLGRTTSIRTHQDLEAFKRMVRPQMYQALAQIGFLGAMGLLALYGIVFDKLSFMEFLLSLLLNGIVFGFGKYGEGFEKKARSLDVEDPDLKEEYTHVCVSWVGKPFPDF